VIRDGQTVSIEYTLKLADGSIADTNVGGEALRYVHGNQEMLPTLEQEMFGMAVGESKHVLLSAADAYGEVDPSLFQTVPLISVPEDAREVGTLLVAQASSGKQRRVRVHEVRGDEIVLDENHPLAGQALAFEVKVLAVE
jgi:FKBP-type peptidyl-prolyl cis-trans isomerase 2